VDGVNPQGRERTTSFHVGSRLAKESSERGGGERRKSEKLKLTPRPELQIWERVTNDQTGLEFIFSQHRVSMLTAASRDTYDVKKEIQGGV